MRLRRSSATGGILRFTPATKGTQLLTATLRNTKKQEYHIYGFKLIILIYKLNFEKSSWAINLPKLFRSPQ